MESNGKELERIEETYGNRTLAKDADPYQHNAWDNVEWDEEQEKEAIEVVRKQLAFKNQDIDMTKFNDENAASHWDEFYTKNENKFFKDRHWLPREFPEMFTSLKPKDAKERPFVYMEIGCGSGSTVFPLLHETRDSNVFVHCCDYSSVAVDLVKSNPDYNTDTCNAFVFDLTSLTPPSQVEKHSVDVVSLIFVLSALTPETWPNAVRNLNYVMKQGGRIIFRDYGRFDMAQLRFKSTRVLGENFYVRGDNTRVYFFTTDEVSEIFKDFIIEKNVVDRKLIVNRFKKVKMYRHWVQGQFLKK